MTDREKVIKGLERIRDWSQFAVNKRWLVAGASEKMVQYAEDALELLKAQEPRVMTAGEMEKLNERICEWLWIEEKQRVTWNLHCLRTFVYSRHPDNGEFYIMADGYREIVKKEGAEYGKTWRCWTSRPTEEQRKAVKWNG